MSSLEEVMAAFSFCIIALAAGLMANTFIIAVNFIDWWRGRHLKASDRICHLLVISRIGSQCLDFLKLISIFLEFDIIFENKLLLDKFFTAVCFYSSVWMSALLSMFYFTKVANYQHILFLHLKRMISQRLRYFIFAVVLISLFYPCLNTWALHCLQAAYNSTYDRQTVENLFISVIYQLGNSGPFIIHICSLVPLLASLFWRMKKMKDSDTGFTSDHLDGYYVAIKSIALCFLIFLLQFITHVVYQMDNDYGKLWCAILMNALSSVHSIYLIYGTPKLRQQFSDMFKCGAK